MIYRPEINGLRAVAVLAVVIYHVWPLYLPGGFLGVDVFLLISGYLITDILKNQQATGKFNLFDFLSRRALRLLPVCFIVVLTTLIFGFFVLTPNQYVTVAKSAVAGILHFANIFFWRTTDYFAPDSGDHPLLHLWSLSLEQQFYLLMPAIVLYPQILFGFGKDHKYRLVIFIAIATFGLWVWASAFKPVASFYLLPTRLWEFMLGGLIALLRRDNEMISSNMASAVGLCLLIFSFFASSNSSFLTGIETIFVVTGTSLILMYCSSNIFLGKILSTTTLSLIGLMSYSIYLWHNPIFSFARIIKLNQISTVEILICFALTFSLSWLTWRFIELPIGSSKKILSSNKLVITLLCGAFLIGLSGIFIKYDGIKSRYSTQQQSILSYEKYDFQSAYRSGDCFLDPAQSYSDFSQKCHTDIGNDESIIIWGDSHAAAMSSAFDPAIDNLVQFTASGCPPLIGIKITSPPRKNCQSINDFVFKALASDAKGTLVLHANWNMYKVDLYDELDQTLEKLLQLGLKKIIVIGNLPIFSPSLPRILLRKGADLTQEVSLAAGSRVRLSENLTIKDLTSSKNVIFLDPFQYLCSKDLFCNAVIKVKSSFKLITWDYGHLTKAGADFVFSKLGLSSIIHDL